MAECVIMSAPYHEPTPRLETQVQIRQARAEDADIATTLIADLLVEIMDRSRMASFAVDLPTMTTTCRNLLANDLTVILLAEDKGWGGPLGLVALSQCNAVYAGGWFGIITELYVTPAARGKGFGESLVQAAVAHANRIGWSRLEVTTPPLPDFDGTLKFYERHGFEITGGRKLNLTA